MGGAKALPNFADGGMNHGYSKSPADHERD